jgi:hypothetical protein
MTLSGYRVLGVVSDPPEVTPDDTLELQVHEFYDGDAPLEHEWRLCLASRGAASDYACLDEGAEFSVGAGPRLQLDLGPSGLALRQRLAALPEVSGEDRTARSVEQGFDVWLKLTSGPGEGDVEPIETVKRLFVRASPTRVPNTNPVIEALRVRGRLDVAGAVTLHVETNAAETYIDSATGEELLEDFLFTWYSTSGVPDPPRSFGEGRSSRIELPDEPGQIEVAVAARDGRGGLAVLRTTLEVR